MRNIPRFLVSFILLALMLEQLACDKRTTFDRIGALATTAARVIRTEADGLLAQKLIDQAKHDSLVKKTDLLVSQAENYSRQLAAFPVINRQNVDAVLAATDGLLTSFRATLTDPELAGVDPASKFIKALNYAILGLEASRGAVAILFPPLPPATATASRSVPSIANAAPSVPAKTIVIHLPPKPY